MARGRKTQPIDGGEDAYVAVAREVQDWIATKIAKNP